MYPSSTSGRHHIHHALAPVPPTLTHQQQPPQRHLRSSVPAFRGGVGSPVVSCKSCIVSIVVLFVFDMNT
eukprot:scaffold1463_cov201-Alexandrium_tamarense.AAC.9